MEFGWRRALRGKIDMRLLLEAAGTPGNVCVTDLVRRLGRGFRLEDQVRGAAREGAGELQPHDLAPPVHSLTRLPRATRRPRRLRPLRSRRSRGWTALLRRRLLRSQAARWPCRCVGWRGQSGRGDRWPCRCVGRRRCRLAPHVSFLISHVLLFSPHLLQSAILWAMAGWGSEEYKSGPAHNAAWLPAFALLLGEQAGAGAAAGGAAPPSAAAESAMSNRAKAVAMLASVRDLWMQRSHQLGRAARHYERAAQLLTSQSVFTAPVAPPEALPEVPAGRWVTATAPARVDLAGGWSDTPPITFEAAPLADDAAAASASAAGSSGGDANAGRSLESIAARGGGFVVNVALQVRTGAVAAVHPPRARGPELAVLLLLPLSLSPGGRPPAARHARPPHCNRLGHAQDRHPDALRLLGGRAACRGGARALRRRRGGRCRGPRRGRL